MKRLYSLFFLLLILLNTLGYYQVLTWAVKQKHAETISRINENRNAIGGNLVIRIPMSLPYPQNDAEYKRASGTLTYQGEVYQMVSKRMHNDTLYVVCLRDVASTKVQKALADCSKEFAGQSGEPRSTSKQGNSFIKFYLHGSGSSVLSQQGWCRILSDLCFIPGYKFISAVTVFQPPRLA